MLRSATIAAICATLVSGCAITITPHSAARGHSSHDAPPERFAHAFDGPIFVQEVQQKQVASRCNAMYRELRPGQSTEPMTGHGYIGCAELFANPETGRFECHIIVAAGPRRREVLAHETAHCNGWGWDHPY